LCSDISLDPEKMFSFGTSTLPSGRLAAALLPNFRSVRSVADHNVW